MFTRVLAAVGLISVAGCGVIFSPAGDAGTPVDGGSALDAGAVAQTVLIPALRNPASGSRPAEGAPLRIADVVVTGVKSVGTNHGFTVQDTNVGAWGGLFVFTGPAAVTVSPGAVVTLVGTFHVFRQLDEIDVSAGSVTQTGTRAVPVALDVQVSDLNDSGARAAELQSMLVRVKNVQVTAVSTGTDFLVAEAVDPATTLTVSSYLANDVGASPFAPAVGQTYASVTGLGYVTGPTAGPFSHKLAPRSPLDLVQ